MESWDDDRLVIAYDRSDGRFFLVGGGVTSLYTSATDDSTDAEDSAVINVNVGSDTVVERAVYRFGSDTWAYCDASRISGSCVMSALWWTPEEVTVVVVSGHISVVSVLILIVAVVSEASWWLELSLAVEG